VPAIPGCVTRGESCEKLLRNLYEAVEACLSVDVKEVQVTGQNMILEIVL
jgi:predicted RNase H-like HicB family nuclease